MLEMPQKEVVGHKDKTLLHAWNLPSVDSCLHSVAELEVDENQDFTFI